MKNWIVLSTPYYHFWMAILALVVLAIVVFMWRSLNRKLEQQHKVLVALCRLDATVASK